MTPSSLAPPPSWAPTIWQDGLDLFAQFPSGLVVRYPLTEGGLQRVLKLLPNVRFQAGFTPSLADRLLRRTPRKQPPRASAQERKQIASSTTDAERKTIAKILKGIP